MWRVEALFAGGDFLRSVGRACLRDQTPRKRSEKQAKRSAGSTDIHWQFVSGEAMMLVWLLGSLSLPESN